MEMCSDAKKRGAAGGGWLVGPPRNHADSDALNIFGAPVTLDRL